MDAECLDAGRNTVQQQSDKNTDLKTSDVYRVNENLAKRFNNPACFKGYSMKMAHPLYKTTNQIYGSKKPTVHEMPTTFHGSWHKFSDLILKSGMFRDTGFNTSLEKSKITGPNTINMRNDRITFHHLYHPGGNEQAETNKT
ncbi:hypothetical protein AMELA_G00263780 [Ameiurus melas]|uniref:Uncharacterized protein n=1 Tax=Ameiurus melas TaxID=219545 RepID=A0A7J5ZPX0_AMEME|nr:hypothetical protein AMELA_G00263780 [Ameiurus melas]